VQVSMLRLNAGISRAVTAAETLERQNSILRADISKLDAGDRIADTAAAQGMIRPPAGDVNYLDARKADGSAAAKGIHRPQPAKVVPPPATTTTTPQAQAATAPAPTATTPAPAQTVPQQTVPTQTVPQQTVPQQTVPQQTVPQQTATPAQPQAQAPAAATAAVPATTPETP
jgi:hypothetical protein